MARLVLASTGETGAFVVALEGTWKRLLDN